MQERQRQQQQTLAIGGSPADDADEGTGGLVRVSHAPFSEELPVAEMSVRAIRENFRDRLDIHPEAVGFIDGESADDDTVVHEGQRLMFMRPSGEKGAGRG